ncbi:hypothetical protein V1294_005974 [Bradyrhizobium sp. AZCC 1678]
MSSRCRSVAPTTRICIATATRRPGGRTCRSCQCLLPSNCGTQAKPSAKMGPRLPLPIQHRPKDSQHECALWYRSRSYTSHVARGVRSSVAPALALPGESLERYQLMRQIIFAELAPRSAIEWLLAVDVVELSWEIQRYRVLRHKLLEHYRENAIEQSLHHIDLAGIPPEIAPVADHIRRNALNWRVNPTARREIEARLAAYGYDSNAINTQVYLQARDVFLVFEALLNSAQSRRLSLLREIKRSVLRAWP